MDGDRVNCETESVMPPKRSSAPVVVQIIAKLGGRLCSLELPLKNLMMIGFDVHHSAKESTNRKAAGAMVSTTSATANYVSYFSTISYHESKEELVSNMVSDTTKCLHEYKKVNGVLPESVIFFRDGVEDGQVHVLEDESGQINTTINQLYEESGAAIPKFTFIIVAKKINTRYVDVSGSRRPDNAAPGTVVDNTITLPEGYDFFVVVCAKHRTVSPCNFYILLDSQDFDPDKLQRLTYKMCHVYFNWSGTDAVPAPCQRAHKLAFLAGTLLDAQPSVHLPNLLNFL